MRMNTTILYLKSWIIPAINNEVSRLLFPLQHAACTGVQQRIEHRLLGSAPSFSKSFTIS